MLDELRTYCLSKPFVSESFPFDDTTLVFKLHHKIFALISLEQEPLRMNLKCDPQKAILFREKYYQVIPGYHSNKKHWNSIILENLPIPIIKKTVLLEAIKSGQYLNSNKIQLIINLSNA